MYLSCGLGWKFLCVHFCISHSSKEKPSFNPELFAFKTDHQWTSEHCNQNLLPLQVLHFLQEYEHLCDFEAIWSCEISCGEGKKSKTGFSILILGFFGLQQRKSSRLGAKAGSRNSEAGMSPPRSMTSPSQVLRSTQLAQNYGEEALNTESKISKPSVRDRLSEEQIAFLEDWVSHAFIQMIRFKDVPSLMYEFLQILKIPRFECNFHLKTLF